MVAVVSSKMHTMQNLATIRIWLNKTRIAGLSCGFVQHAFRRDHLRQYEVAEGSSSANVRERKHTMDGILRASICVFSAEPSF